MNTLTHDQFQDVSRYILANGYYTCFPGLDVLKDCEEIPDPEFSEYRDVLFLKDRLPFAVYECGFGFRVLPVPEDIPLTRDQFEDVAQWLQERGQFRGCVGLDLICNCDVIDEPADAWETETGKIYVRNGHPFMLEIADTGFIVAL